jgi:hypothetical protein
MNECAHEAPQTSVRRGANCIDPVDGWHKKKIFFKNETGGQQGNRGSHFSLPTPFLQADKVF